MAASGGYWVKAAGRTKFVQVGSGARNIMDRARAMDRDLSSRRAEALAKERAWRKKNAAFEGYYNTKGEKLITPPHRGEYHLKFADKGAVTFRDTRKMAAKQRLLRRIYRVGQLPLLDMDRAVGG